MIADGYEGIVYDLDGTLVRLDVDWAAVASDVRAVYGDAGVDPGTSDLWELLSRADEHDLAADVEAAIAAHERAGARSSRALPPSDDVAGLPVPVGVCSLNCEDACRIALETHGLDAAVDAVVGRDTVATRKPDPEPLLAAVRALDVPPERALFVGDSRRDEVAAERAGIDYRYVSALEE